MQKKVPMTTWKHIEKRLSKRNRVQRIKQLSISQLVNEKMNGVIIKSIEKEKCCRVQNKKDEQLPM